MTLEWPCCAQPASMSLTSSMQLPRLIDFRIHATEAIAFSSPKLVPSLTNPFWLEFSQRVLVEGFPLQQALTHMLATTSTSPFVRHTNLLYARIPQLTTEPVVCYDYVWTHPEFRPFGHRLPVNCPGCGCIDTFGPPRKQTPASGTKYTFQCRGHKIDASLCQHQIVVVPMDGFEAFGHAQNGARWMQRVLSRVIE